MKQCCSFTVVAVLIAFACPGCEKKASNTNVNGGGTVVSTESITVEDGKVTIGRPVVTEDVKREIYKTLNHRRKMIAAIQKNAGSSRGIKQMQDELELLTKASMSRYGISQADIDAILKEGDANSWE